ncbi:hypothetical protein AAHA92_16309 [Salvia divinorum]|uniref:GRF-type domain-containing protein n=1 Tax=Salvia divinorum TaxID=28513 RepID=A0ABD1GV50_SALDI
MERSRCNWGSSNNGVARDPRFSYVFCNCKKVALLCIVTSQGKPTREKLYFVCERKECCFFKWCEPIDEDKAVSSLTSLLGFDFEQAFWISGIDFHSTPIVQLPTLLPLALSLLTEGSCWWKSWVFGELIDLAVAIGFLHML